MKTLVRTSCDISTMLTSQVAPYLGNFWQGWNMNQDASPGELLFLHTLRAFYAILYFSRAKIVRLCLRRSNRKIRNTLFCNAQTEISTWNFNSPTNGSRIIFYNILKNLTVLIQYEFYDFIKMLCIIWKGKSRRVSVLKALLYWTIIYRFYILNLTFYK